MTFNNKTFEKILDALAHGSFFNEQDIWEHSGYKKIDVEEKIADLKNGTVQAATCSEKNYPELYEMITKSLALLTKFPHGHDNDLKPKTGYSKQTLANLLERLWGKPVTTEEYQNILNQ